MAGAAEAEHAGGAMKRNPSRPLSSVNPNRDDAGAPAETASNSPPSHEEIARRAYARWEESGRGDGDDLGHWYAAESELRRNRRSGGSPVSSRAHENSSPPAEEEDERSARAESSSDDERF